MKLTNKITSVSALAFVIGMGMSAPVMAGGLADYLDDGDGYDDSYVAPAAGGDDGMIAADDSGDDLFAAAAPAPAAAEPAGPDMDSVEDDQLAALDEEPDCSMIGNKEPESETDSQGELDELEDQVSSIPCQSAGAGGADTNNANDLTGGGNNGGGASESVALVSVGDLNDPTANDSLLQVNVGTPDRTGPDAEGPAIIEVALLDGIVGGDGSENSGALQVTVLDVINGDGRLLDTDPSGGALEPLQALGAVAALGLDPAPAGAVGPNNDLGGLAEANIGDDFDGPGDFNVIQANLPLGPLEPLVTETVGIEQVALLNLLGQGGDGLSPVADINGPLGVALSPLLGLGGDLPFALPLP